MNGWRLGAHRVVGRSPARAGRFPEPPTETPDPHRFTGAERITLTRVLSVAMLLTVVLLLSAHLDQDAAEAEAASDVASPLPPGILTGNLPATTSSSSTSTTSSTSTSTVTDPSTTSSTSSTTSSSVLPITTAPRAVPTTRASTIVTPIDDGTGGFRLRPGVAHAYPAYLIRFGNLVPPAVGAEVDFARLAVVEADLQTRPSEAVRARALQAMQYLVVRMREIILEHALEVSLTEDDLGVRPAWLDHKA